MNLPDEIPEDELTSAQRRTRFEMYEFLDELTEMTRRTLIVVTSQGNVDIPTLRKISKEEAERGRYVRFWENTTFSYPEDIIWDRGNEDVHLINFDRVDIDEFEPEFWTPTGEPLL